MTAEIEIERAARCVVNSTFDNGLLRDEAIELLKANRTISEAVRQKALQFAAVYSFDRVAVRLNSAAWKIVALPRQSQVSYERARRLAAAALEVDPENAGVRNTLGVAEYREGLYEESLATLLKSDATLGGIAENAAFIAMAQWQLGMRDQARKTLHHLREVMTNRDDDQAKRFLREAETLIKGNDAENGDEEQSAREPAEP